MEVRKIRHWVVRTSVLLISYSAQLCNWSCIIKTSETLIVWSAFCYNAESDPGRNKRDARLTAEEWQQYLRYTVAMLKSCWPTDVPNQHRFSFFRECVQWLNIMLKFLGIFSVVWFLWTWAKYIWQDSQYCPTLDKEMNILYIEPPRMSSYTEVISFKNGPVFWPTNACKTV